MGVGYVLVSVSATDEGTDRNTGARAPPISMCQHCPSNQHALPLPPSQLEKAEFLHFFNISTMAELVHLEPNLNRLGVPQTYSDAHQSSGARMDSAAGGPDWGQLRHVDHSACVGHNVLALPHSPHAQVSGTHAIP